MLQNHTVNEVVNVNLILRVTNLSPREVKKLASVHKFGRQWIFFWIKPLNFPSRFEGMAGGEGGADCEYSD